MQVEVHNNSSGLPLTDDQVKNIIEYTSTSINLIASSITVIFVDDEKLARMHGEFLNDPTPTDIITFDLGEDKTEGEIYISTQRASEQAKQFNCTESEELLRLIVHGLLHLKGYNDLAEKDLKEMKTLENQLVEKLSRLYL